MIESNLAIILVFFFNIILFYVCSFFFTLQLQIVVFPTRWCLKWRVSYGSSLRKPLFQWNFRITIAPLIEYVKLCISAEKKLKTVQNAGNLIIFVSRDCSIAQKLKKHFPEDIIRTEFDSNSKS